MNIADILCEADSLSSALERQNQLTDILNSWGMWLNKWYNNASKLSQINEQIYPLGDSKESKALGVL